jgi:hypothetical protein
MAEFLFELACWIVEFLLEGILDFLFDDEARSGR